MPRMRISGSGSCGFSSRASFIRMTPVIACSADAQLVVRAPLRDVRDDDPVAGLETRDHVNFVDRSFAELRRDALGMIPVGSELEDADVRLGLSISGTRDEYHAVRAIELDHTVDR